MDTLISPLACLVGLSPIGRGGVGMDLMSIYAENQGATSILHVGYGDIHFNASLLGGHLAHWVGGRWDGPD